MTATPTTPTSPIAESAIVTGIARRTAFRRLENGWGHQPKILELWGIDVPAGWVAEDLGASGCADDRCNHQSHDPERSIVRVRPIAGSVVEVHSDRDDRGQIGETIFAVVAGETVSFWSHRWDRGFWDRFDSASEQQVDEILSPTDEAETFNSGYACANCFRTRWTRTRERQRQVWGPWSRPRCIWCEGTVVLKPGNEQVAESTDRWFAQQIEERQAERHQAAFGAATYEQSRDSAWLDAHPLSDEQEQHIAALDAEIAALCDAREAAKASFADDLGCRPMSPRELADIFAGEKV